MMIVVFVWILINFKFSVGFNIDLIFSLQQHFYSDVILLEKQQENEKMVKKLLRHQNFQPKAFIGLFDLSNIYKLLIDTPGSVKYRNELIIFYDKNNFIKKLIKVQEIDPSVMTSFIWIYIKTNPDEALDLDLLNIPYNSKFFLVKEISFFKFEIIDVYQITSTSPKIYSRYAVWENEELKLFKENIYSDRMNLHKHEIVASSLPGGGLYNKFKYWDFWSECMNFTFKHILVTSVGFSLKNGTKTGIIKQIYEKEVDSSLVIYSVSSERIHDFDYIMVTTADTNVYMVVNHGSNWKAFLTPFKIDIWISVFVWLALAYFLVYIINRMISSIFKYHVQDPLFNLITALSSQGKSIKVERFSLYFVALMPYVLGMVLLQHYSANLLGHLTVKDTTPPFRNLRDVVRDGTYEITSLYPSSIWVKISDVVKAEARRPIKLVPIGPVETYTGMFFQDLCTNRRVAVTGTYNYDVRVDCSIMELPEAIDFQTLGVMFRKNYPYLEVMTKLMRKFLSEGLSKLEMKNIVRELEKEYTIQPVELEIIFPAFILLIIFLCLSFIIFLSEIFIWKFKKKRERNKRKIRVVLPKLEFF